MNIKIMPSILYFGASLVVILATSCTTGFPAQLGGEGNGFNDVSLPDQGPAPELVGDTWLNTDHPLRLADLKGEVVLLDVDLWLNKL